MQFDRRGGARASDEIGTQPLAPTARFDDTATASPGTQYRDAQRVLVATTLDQVAPLIDAVEARARAGEWVVGFLAYEGAPGLDPTLEVRPRHAGGPFGDLPLAWFATFAAPIAVPPLEPRPVDGPVPAYHASAWTAEFDDDAHAGKVAAIRSRIAAGDTYQANLTLRLWARTEGDLAELYRDLALAQRGGYCAYLDTGRFAVLSASPELFFDWDGESITTRPMKGTTARGRWSEEDAARADSLRRSGKDRAENVMIVDLVRNDLGRIATPGSMAVPALFDLERYETLWQLTSTVTATTRPGTTLSEVFRALFPSGSVTGAPKRRSMEILATLETSPRGVYCGAIGVVAPGDDGGLRARFGLPIRTVVVDRSTGDAVYGTGGGITWQSDPAAEYAEARLKAAVLARPVESFCLFETMAFVAGTGLRHVGAHLDRLERSAAYFGFRLDRREAEQLLRETLATAAAPLRVRLHLERSGVLRVETAPAPKPDATPVRLALDTVAVRSDDVWLFHKTTRRGTYDQAASRHRDADDVILCNERGELTETTIANLAVLLNGTWWTPPLESGCLPGIERAFLLDTGRLRTRAIAREELDQASGLATVNSLRGWRIAALEGGQDRR